MSVKERNKTSQIQNYINSFDYVDLSVWHSGLNGNVCFVPM